GRQPYHGHSELIASNHSKYWDTVTIQHVATVTQIRRENEEEIQTALYWRQTLDVFTKKVSAIKGFCHCNQPQNPDKVMIQCPSEKCNRWLHEECLRHQILLNMYNHLQTGEKNRVLDTELRLGGQETNNRDVEMDGADEFVEHDEGVEPNVVPLPLADDASLRPRNGQPLTMPICVASRRGRKKVVRSVRKPYEGQLRAEFNSEDDVFEITYSIAGDEGEKRWRVGFNCTICGTYIH
ncbi:hypothetical protein F5883DRAFT_430628, partial [Diaporthe sp. PMI_573]